MAYLNFADAGAGTATYRRESTGFSGLEWSVIALAERDRLPSLRKPGRIATALAALFGTSQNARLADDRLEALRRMAVLAWHKSYSIPVAELRAFKAAGFTNGQYETLLSSISRGRAQSRKQRS